MFEEKPHSPHSDRNRSGPAARNSEKKSRIMARENDCGRRERFWLARTILSRENDPSSGERLWSRERFWSEPGLRRSSSSTIPQATGVGHSLAPQASPRCRLYSAGWRDGLGATNPHTTQTTKSNELTGSGRMAWGSSQTATQETLTKAPKPEHQTP